MNDCDIHLDPVGGVAGDMFVGAMLDAFPEFEGPCLTAIAGLLGSHGGIKVNRVQDHGFAGMRFQVTAADHQPSRGLIQIRQMIQEAELPSDVVETAWAIVDHLALAEAAVHGIAPDDVHFHEVGAIDSIADIAAAAFLISQCQGAGWSIAPLPMGGGTIGTDHGVIPVPAPATARLLEGMALVDDGIDGERVTPTGAAILKQLAPSPRLRSGPKTLKRSGHGFGSRNLPDRANMLRVLVFDAVCADDRDQVGVISFDIDDQTPEDLACALARIRDEPSVLDCIQWQAIGKYGRMVSVIRILCEPAAIDRVVDRVFDETSTIGVRVGIEQRRILVRQERLIDGVNVKLVMRPSGVTAKADIRDLTQDNRSARQRQRDRAERHALQDGFDDG